MLQAPILHFYSLDSTNNRAAQMIDADTAQAGLTIIAQEQSSGKGQRGNIWSDEAGKSLLMSIILQPTVAIDAQFSFSAAISVAVAEAIQSLDPSMDVRIKFPNDIIINDKKAAGILIENSLRGNNWTHAIVGIGINLLQKEFPKHLPNATSLFLATGKEWTQEEILNMVRTKAIENTSTPFLKHYLDRYNQLLYKRSQIQTFANGEEVFDSIILGVDEKGQLFLQFADASIKNFAHGKLNWVW